MQTYTALNLLRRPQRDSTPAINLSSVRKLSKRTKPEWVQKYPSIKHRKYNRYKSKHSNADRLSDRGTTAT